LAQQVRDLHRENQQLAEQLRQTQARLEQTLQQLQQHEEFDRQRREQPRQLPNDLPLKHHSYGPKMIALCMNLCRHIGFRPTETALRIIFEWLGVEADVPSWSAIRTWSCRLGVAQLQEPVEAADDWIWMADHSIQIGAARVLQILGVRASQLPPPGEPLHREDLRVLAVAVRANWNREAVREAYRKLAQRAGPPRYLITDGAVELRESADVLEKPGRKLTLLRDLKHVAANRLERLIGQDEAFREFLSRLGRTRSAIQQTELAHFTPPPPKPKARFMNLGPILRWGQMASYHLAHPRSQARRGIAVQRMNEKLGWLRRYREALARWSRCQEVLEASLQFINRQGVYRGAGAALHAVLEEQRRARAQPCPTSETLATQLVAFVQESEAELAPGERAWLSTENLESAFGVFKRAEGQHSKGGFTSLVAAMPMLLSPWTPERVRQLLPTAPVQTLKHWVREELGATLASQRAAAYQEFAAAPG
jgi:hypothetical protein